ncbi:hypothetical protein [Nitrosovibrio sp. Nv4]|uniref:hypothetical protein n=1 Tax=Nitrosovibrio sp. Nv4 TaxID=1945880 RepID=UPI0011B1F5F9|nr:hypothetical protein [Nitrosovibrio sp. Nv4]
MSKTKTLIPKSRLSIYITNSSIIATNSSIAPPLRELILIGGEHTTQCPQLGDRGSRLFIASPRPLPGYKLKPGPMEVPHDSVRLDDRQCVAASLWSRSLTRWRGLPRAASTLRTTPEGFVRVKSALQAINYPWILGREM